MAALTELRKRQAKESERAGPTYRAGLEDLGWYIEGDEYIVTDEFTRILVRDTAPSKREGHLSLPRR